MSVNSIVRGFRFLLTWRELVASAPLIELGRDVF